MPNGCFPRLNDCVFGQEKLIHSDIYEFAYSYYADPGYVQALDIIYSRKNRINTDFILYGNEHAPLGNALPIQTFNNDSQLGLTLFQQPETQSTVLINIFPTAENTITAIVLALLFFTKAKSW